MKSKMLGALALAAFALSAALPALAAPVTLTLDYAAFTGGATGSGSFTIDSDAQTRSSFTISTTPGVLSALTYD